MTSRKREREESILDFDNPQEIEQILEGHRQTAVPSFWANKYEKEQSKNWDKFYKKNTTNFFKDRHYLDREFIEFSKEYTKTITESENRLVQCLEAGCGVGNAAFPLLERNEDLFFNMVDFSPRAVEFVKTNDGFQENRCKAWVADLTARDSLLSGGLESNSLDLILCLFVLSTVHPDKFQSVVDNLAHVLRPGGRLLFRDYGRHDYAQLRFKNGSMLSENFYVRQDGTRAYYFTLQEVDVLMTKAGLSKISNEYCTREMSNKKQKTAWQRRWVQAVYEKRKEEN